MFLALRAVAVAKLVILSNFVFNLIVLSLRVVPVAKLVMSDNLSSIFLIWALYTSFSTTSIFTTPFSLLKLTWTGTNLSTSCLSTCFTNYSNYLVHFSISQCLINVHRVLNQLNQLFDASKLWCINTCYIF